MGNQTAKWVTLIPKSIGTTRNTNLHPENHIARLKNQIDVQKIKFVHPENQIYVFFLRPKNQILVLKKNFLVKRFTKLSPQNIVLEKIFA